MAFLFQPTALQEVGYAVQVLERVLASALPAAGLVAAVPDDWANGKRLPRLTFGIFWSWPDITSKSSHVLVGSTFQNGSVIHVCFYAWMILEDCFVAFLCWLSLLFGADCLDVKESSRLWSRKKKHDIISNWQKYKGSLNIQQPYFCSGQTTNMTWNAVRSPWRISRKRFQEGSTSLTVTTNRRNFEFDLEQRFVLRCSKQFLGLLSLIGLYLHHRLHHGTDRVWCMCGAILNWSSQTRHTTLWEKRVLCTGVSLDGER